MATIIYKRHWGAILKSDDKCCQNCGKRATHSLVDEDDNDPDVIFLLSGFAKITYPRTQRAINPMASKAESQHLELRCVRQRGPLFQLFLPHVW